MRSELKWGLALGAVSTALLGSYPVAAQALPAGTYLSSCRSTVVSQSQSGGRLMLQATCRARSGPDRTTQLEFEACRGDIANDDGRLVCAGGVVSSPAGPPPGSYQRTCTGIDLVGSTLRAECRDQRGALRSTSLDLRACRGDIGNDSGRLVCTGATSGNPGPVPPPMVRDGNPGPFPQPYGRDGNSGPYSPYARYGDQGPYPRPDGPGQSWPSYPPPLARDGIILFDRYGLRGRSHWVPEERFNLREDGFNDLARSLHVEGRGRWELCSDAKFRGRCITVDRDIYDLSQLGMADVVSSVRRVR